jgi:ribosomal protein L24
MRAMTLHTFNVSVGDQVYLEEGGEELGAVREVAKDHLIVYVENAGDQKITGAAVTAAHDGKVILDRAHLTPAFLKAARLAHNEESE